MKPVTATPNFQTAFGPASRRMLSAAGLDSLDAILALGSVESYRRTKRAHPKASLNLLWAIEGVISGKDWRILAREDRLRLLLALDALETEGAPC